MDAPSLRLAAVPAQAMRVPPRQVIFAGLLELSGAELQDAIERELADNPALVRDARDFPTLPLVPSSAGPRVIPDDLPAMPEAPATALVSDVAAGLPRGDRWLAEYVLSDLDDRGLLGRSVEALAIELRVCRVPG